MKSSSRTMIAPLPWTTRPSAVSKDLAILVDADGNLITTLRQAEARFVVRSTNFYARYRVRARLK